MADKRVTEESFGTDPKNIPVSKGKIEIFGHTPKDAAIPSRGTSPNVKTGYPANASK